MRISDWSSDVCSSDLENEIVCRLIPRLQRSVDTPERQDPRHRWIRLTRPARRQPATEKRSPKALPASSPPSPWPTFPRRRGRLPCATWSMPRSEEHTSELQSLMRISYAVFCLKKQKQTKKHYETN